MTLLFWVMVLWLGRIKLKLEWNVRKTTNVGAVVVQMPDEWGASVCVPNKDSVILSTLSLNTISRIYFVKIRTRQRNCHWTRHSLKIVGFFICFSYVEDKTRQDVTRLVETRTRVICFSRGSDLDEEFRRTESSLVAAVARYELLSLPLSRSVFSKYWEIRRQRRRRTREYRRLPPVPRCDALCRRHLRSCRTRWRWYFLLWIFEAAQPPPAQRGTQYCGLSRATAAAADIPPPRTLTQLCVLLASPPRGSVL